MRTILFSVIISILLFSCDSNQSENTNTQTKADTTTKPASHMVGNDADEHGCKASAGYTFSIIKNRCVRLFEDGVRLDPVKQDSSATISAFAIFADDSTNHQAELFVPNSQGSVLLKETSNQVWQNEGWQLTKNGKAYILENTNTKTIEFISE